jgi:hypothetical protein
VSLVVSLTCGDTVRLVTDAREMPTDDLPRTFYPLIDEHPLETGDFMTCPICDSNQVVTVIINDSGGEM